MTHTPTIVEFSERKVVGLGGIGKQIKPGDVWPALFNRIDEVNDRLNQLETIGLIKRNEQGYLAGVETSIQSEAPEGMYSYIIPSGKYATVTHKGPLSKMNETFDGLINWLETNNFEQFDVICFEVYDHRYKGEDGESEFDMFIQIKSVD